MPVSKPKITFLFPLRWLKEDKEYLSENIKRKVVKEVGIEGLNILKRVFAYSVVISYQYNKPIDVPVNKTQLQKYLKPVFPNGKCIEFDTRYEQHPSKTMLPLMDFQLYFD